MTKLQPSASLVIALLSTFVCGSAGVSATTYHIEPVSLSDGFEITGGVIVTDGTIGQLTSSSITDYQVAISGPVSMAFSPSDPDANILGFLVIATPNELLLELGPTTRPEPRHFLGFSNSEMVGGSDEARSNLVAWDNGWDSIQDNVTRTLIGFSSRLTDGDGRVIANSGSSGTLRESPQRVLVIARVPEPASIGILLPLTVIGSRRRYRLR